ncbi:hypothetical protein [Streptomyces sp. NPDC058735]|uniref:hypothetical protein n=1 Tax=unclassified Streptomyces TaxID=2593676 RepID=UPI0036A97E85
MSEQSVHAGAKKRSVRAGAGAADYSRSLKSRRVDVIAVVGAIGTGAGRFAVRGRVAHQSTTGAGA